MERTDGGGGEVPLTGAGCAAVEVADDGLVRSGDEVAAGRIAPDRSGRQDVPDFDQLIFYLVAAVRQEGMVISVEAFRFGQARADRVQRPPPRELEVGRWERVPPTEKARKVRT